MVVIVDYGMGNLRSVQKALERIGSAAVVSDEAESVASAERLVVPGVGAFADAMAGLRCLGLDEVVREVAVRGTPLLGICLGMEMLLDESEEFGTTAGLGLIPGRVVPVPATASDGEPVKIPHIGWSALALPEGRGSWKGTLLDGVTVGSAVYFIHSFMARPDDPADRVADCTYGGRPISAVIGRGNVVGCQFHPEKSGQVGLMALRRFLDR